MMKIVLVFLKMHQVKIPVLSVSSQFDDIQLPSEVFSAVVKLPSLSSIWEFLSSQSLKYLQKFEWALERPYHMNHIYMEHIYMWSYMTLPKDNFETEDFSNFNQMGRTLLVVSDYLSQWGDCFDLFAPTDLYVTHSHRRINTLKCCHPVCWVNVCSSKCRLEQGRLWWGVPGKPEQNWELKSFQTFAREGKGSAGQSGRKFRVRHQVEIWSSVKKASASGLRRYEKNMVEYFLGEEEKNII